MIRVQSAKGPPTFEASRSVLTHSTTRLKITRVTKWLRAKSQVMDSPWKRRPDCDRWAGPRAISQLPPTAGLPTVMASTGHYTRPLYIHKTHKLSAVHQSQHLSHLCMTGRSINKMDGEERVSEIWPRCYTTTVYKPFTLVSLVPLKTEGKQWMSICIYSSCMKQL